MEKSSMGSFIAVLRKARGMTQRQLAERLNVSDKTVSRWERDEGSPDLSLIPVLAEIFEVSCDELLRGQRQSEAGEGQSQRGQREQKNLILRQRRHYEEMLAISMAVAAAGLLAGIGLNFGALQGRIALCGALALELVAALLLIIFRSRSKTALEGWEQDDELLSMSFRQTRQTQGAALAILVLSAAVLPFGAAPYNAGLELGSWLAAAALLALPLLLLGLLVIYLVNGHRVKSGSQALPREEAALYTARHRHLGRCSLELLLAVVITLVPHLLLTELYGPIGQIEGETFYDLESFEQYMGEPAAPERYAAPYAVPELDSYAAGEHERRARIEAPDGRVLLEFTQRNMQVIGWRCSFRDGELLRISTYTEEDLREAREKIGRRHVYFGLIYAVEILACGEVYIRKRPKEAEV